MPKLSYEIKDFSAGAITNADLQDIPDGAASDSLNIASMGPLGTASPILKHTEIMGGYDEVGETFRPGLPKINNMLVRDGLELSDKNLALNVGTNFIYIENYRTDDKFSEFMEIVNIGQMLLSDTITDGVTNPNAEQGKWQIVTGNIEDYNTRKAYFTVVPTKIGYVYEVRANYISSNLNTASNEEAGYMIALKAQENEAGGLVSVDQISHVTTSYTGSSSANGTWSNNLCDRKYFHSNQVKTFEFTAESDYSVIVLVGGNVNAPAAAGDATPDTITADALRVQFSKGGYLWKDLGDDLDFTNTDKGLFIGSSSSPPYMVNKMRDDDGVSLEFIEKQECFPVSGPTAMSNVDFLESLYSYDTTNTTSVEYLVGGIKGEPYLWVFDRDETTITLDDATTIDTGYTDFVKSVLITWTTDGLGGLKFIPGEKGASTGQSEFLTWGNKGMNLYHAKLPDTNDTKYNSAFNVDLVKSYPLDTSQDGLISDGAYVANAVWPAKAGPIYVLLDKEDGGFSHGENMVIAIPTNGDDQFPVYTVQGGYHLTAYTGWNYKWNGPLGAKWYRYDVDPKGGHDFYWTKNADTAATPPAYAASGYAAVDIDPANGYGEIEEQGGIKNMCWVNTSASDVNLSPSGGISISRVFDSAAGYYRNTVIFSVVPNGDTKFLKYSGKWKHAKCWPNNWPDGDDHWGEWTHRTEAQELVTDSVLVSCAVTHPDYSVTQDKYFDNSSSIEAMSNALAPLKSFQSFARGHNADIQTYKQKVQRPFPLMTTGAMNNYSMTEEYEGLTVHTPWTNESRSPRSWKDKPYIYIYNSSSIEWKGDTGLRPQIYNGWDKMFGFPNNMKYEELITLCENSNDIVGAKAKAQELIDLMNDASHVGEARCTDYYGLAGDLDKTAFSHYFTETTTGVHDSSYGDVLMPLPTGTSEANNIWFDHLTEGVAPSNTWANGTGTADYAWTKEKRLNTTLYRLMEKGIAAWAWIQSIAAFNTEAKSTAYSTFVQHTAITANSYKATGFDGIHPGYTTARALSFDTQYVSTLVEDTNVIKISKMLLDDPATGTYNENLRNLTPSFKDFTTDEGGHFVYEELEYEIYDSTSDGAITRTPTGEKAAITEYAICTRNDGSVFKINDEGTGGGDLTILPASTNGLVISAFTGDVIVRTMKDGASSVVASPFDSGDLRIGLTPTLAEEVLSAGSDPTDAEKEECAYLKNETLIYNMSFLYDGYQESPLMGSPVTIDVKDTSETNFVGTKGVNLEVRLGSTNPRITAVCVYVKKRMFDKYRLVEQVEMDNYWTSASEGAGGALLSSTAKMTSGISITIQDKGNPGISYEALTGMPERLYHTLPQYNYSALVSDYLFISKSTHPSVDNAERMIFRSLPGKYSMFNWATDYLGLPEPVAVLKSAYNRLIAFSSNAMYQIDPFNLSIEHKFLGYGVNKAKSVAIAGGVLYFANKKGVYMYAGGKFKHLSGKIQDVWDEIFKDHPNSIPILANDNHNDSLLVLFDNAGSGSIDIPSKKVLTFHISLRRWDILEFPANITCATTDAKGDIIFAAHSTEVAGTNAQGMAFDTTNFALWETEQSLEPESQTFTELAYPYALYQLYGGADKERLQWTSKELTLGEDLRDKKFKKVKVLGKDVVIDKIWIDDIIMDYTSEPATVGGTDYTAYETEDDGTADYIKLNKTGKKIKFRISTIGDSVDSYIDSVGITYSLKSIK